MTYALGRSVLVLRVSDLSEVRLVSSVLAELELCLRE